MMKRTLILSAMAIMAACSLSAQQLSFMINTPGDTSPDKDNKTEFPSGSTFYVDGAKGTTDGAEIIFETWLNPVPALVGTSVDFTITKLDHKGNANWGISLLCAGLACTQANSYDDEYKSKDKHYTQGCKLEEYKKNTEQEGFFYWENTLKANYDFKGDLIKTVDEYKVRYDFFKHGTTEKIATCDVRIKSWGGVSVTGVELQRVVMVSQPGGACTLQYDSEGKDLTLEVFDLAGNLTFRSALPAGSATYRLPVLLPQGVSIFRLTESGKPIFTQKYLIK